jgi:hypothetical protein
MTKNFIYKLNFIMTKKIFLLMLFLIISSSCSTPYQKQSWYSHRGGYSAIKLTDNSFRVTFNGNAITDGNTAIDFALLRSAELAKLNDFKYFVIAINNKSTMYHETHNGIRELFGRPSVINLIYCYKNKPLDFNNKIYEVSEVINEIKSKYNIGFSSE